MTQPLQTLKGFRDFLPEAKRKREYIASIIKRTYELYGFAPIETPTLEYADLLLGKYGTEADTLVYTFEDRGGRQVGLRYDQTVPTARILAQYQNELPRMFRRYQMQNVFRADKPQQGRYREFTQCDCDIFGADSPLADAELLSVFYATLKAIGFKNIRVELNDRETLLSTLSPFTTPSVSVFSLIQSIDKLDKQTPEQVSAELVKKGLTQEAANKALDEIENAQMSENLQEIVDIAIKLGVPKDVLIFNPKIARGLDYYTGLIFEGKIPEYTVGSIGGGGPYNNLINTLSGGKVSVAATGFAFGFDRLVEAAELLQLIPTQALSNTQVLVGVFSQATLSQTLAAATQLRDAGIRTELYPKLEQLSKQFKTADQKNIPFVLLIGEEEASKNLVTLKNTVTRTQEVLSLENAISAIQKTPQ